ncbi:unnamed protein product [Urochloa humidicola]
MALSVQRRCSDRPLGLCPAFHLRPLRLLRRAPNPSPFPSPTSPRRPSWGRPAAIAGANGVWEMSRWLTFTSAYLPLPRHPRD